MVSKKNKDNQKNKSFLKKRIQKRIKMLRGRRSIKNTQIRHPVCASLPSQTSEQREYNNPKPKHSINDFGICFHKIKICA